MKFWNTFWIKMRVFHDSHCEESVGIFHTKQRCFTRLYDVTKIFSGQDYEVWYEILCLGDCIHCIVHSTKLQAYDLYAPSTMASDDHSSVSLSTSKRRLVFFAAIDVSRGCALSTLIMYDGISNSNFNNNHASYLQLVQWNCYKFNH